MYKGGWYDKFRRSRTKEKEGRFVEVRKERSKSRANYQQKMEDRRCYRCNKVGHISYDCPKKRA